MRQDTSTAVTWHCAVWLRRTMGSVPSDFVEKCTIKRATCEDLSVAVIHSIAVAAEVPSTQTFVASGEGDDRQ